MEPEVRAFLVKIANSLGMVLLWMLLNMIAGIRYGLAFFEQKPHWYNYLYYVLALITLTLLVLYLKKKWKGVTTGNID
jgi:hypothetical protein